MLITRSVQHGTKNAHTEGSEGRRPRSYARKGLVPAALLGLLAGCGADADTPPVDASTVRDAGVADVVLTDPVDVLDPLPDGGPMDTSDGAISVNRPELVPATDERIATLKVPQGFELRVFARNVEGARMLAVGPDGSIYVTSPSMSQVWRLRDLDGDNDADDPGERTVVASLTDGADLAGVHGIAIAGTQVYLASVKAVFSGSISNGQFVSLRAIVTDLPDGSQHPNRTLGIGPDQKLYVSVGSACNACAESNSEHATMLRVELDGAPTYNAANPAHPVVAHAPMAKLSPRIFASGLRNTLGFDWHPTTGELWGSDHGSDGLGDDMPADELNRISEGTSYGWPYCWGDGQVDPVIDDPSRSVKKGDYCKSTAASRLDYPAHNAPIAFAFYRGSTFPADYVGDAFVAFRGSWNRSVASGYKVVRVHFENGVPQPRAGTTSAIEDFLTGFLIDNGHQFGRLAGLTVDAGGALLVSDDSNGMIYRIAATPNRPRTR